MANIRVHKLKYVHYLGSPSYEFSYPKTFFHYSRLAVVFAENACVCASVCGVSASWRTLKGLKQSGASIESAENVFSFVGLIRWSERLLIFFPISAFRTQCTSNVDDVNSQSCERRQILREKRAIKAHRTFVSHTQTNTVHSVLQVCVPFSSRSDIILYILILPERWLCVSHFSLLCPSVERPQRRL